MANNPEATIVVVDDEPSIRELVSASLHFSGFDVKTASNGTEAIDVITQTNPDIVVLDVMLPDIDGFTVTRRIRQQGVRHRCCSSPPVMIRRIRLWALQSAVMIM